MPEKDSNKIKRSSSNSSSTAVLISCIGIAVLLWLGAKLSHEYDGFISASIKYNNIPDGYILGAGATKEIILNIRTKGFYLITEKLKRKRVVEIDATLLPVSKEFISAEMMKNIIATNFNNSFLLISVQPDTFYYSLDKEHSKKIPVKLNAQLNFEQQFGPSKKTEIKPKEVLVSGPKKVIDTISFIQTNLLKLNNIKENITGKISLSTGGMSYLKIEPNKVDYNISVEKYTEKVIEVPVSVINTPVKTNVVIFPKKVNVSCMVSLSEYEKVTHDMFKAIADFSKINIEEDKQVYIQIKRKPEFIKIINYTPKKAEFIINK